MPKKLSQLSLHDLLFVVLPILVLIVAAFWGAAQFIKPAPPSRLVISTGGESGAYHRFASLYKDELDDYGIEVVLKPSGGSMDNLARLRDPDFEVDVAFIQGGTFQVSEDDALESLGDVYYEPLWVFYRTALANAPLERITQLKGRRIAIGGAGSGTHHLSMEMLFANGLSKENTTLVAEGGLPLVEKLTHGSLDALFAVGPTQSALVWTLLHTPGVSLMNVVHADAYTRRMPYLSKVSLPRGAIDLVRDLPPSDVNLVAPMATLVVREDTHPALKDLLLQAAAKVHGGPGVFQRPGEFPHPAHSGFPLSKESDRFFKSGRPFLQRYLPFWAATLIDRMVVMLVPLIAVLVPLSKFAPSLYNWRVRSRIFKRYGELKFLESEFDEDPHRYEREAWLTRLDDIARDVNRLPTPLGFADLLYNLRSHIELVRTAVLRQHP